ncbi:MAG: hypothetical protein IPO76_09090 [Elusimicrobia bacterium]|jgi:hypothetical protein|nr:hypothetical protein [Elusimicrobiota bacterium]MBK7545886.1 hypothetical protein [Elusimicrobiota bacterium]MBK7575150.1 hypothetical protein [Elusimicrobiota bacterium]MBK7687586.1 hypothetical protein [Elusimicrobiota bacterium]MBK8125496.1 hypothetical protein [Elusimicrobiota bacterium]
MIDGTTRVFPANPFRRRILTTLLPISLLGGLGATLTLIEKKLSPTGVALVLAAVGVVEVFIIRNILQTARCPGCGFETRRAETPSLHYPCPICRVRWTNPARSQG